MNAPERKVLYLSFCLFAFGILVRLLPWGLPTIESIQIEDSAPRFDVQPAAIASAVDGIVQENSAIADKITGEPESQNREKGGKSQGKKKKKVALPLKINTSSAEELCALKGVGPKLADKIIAHREAHGPFKTAKDLEKVPGIGKKKLESILPGVIFD
ncbi:MAG: helix-hairpin-helix domain-containing protein [Fibrobacter sp.]|nr:helix-hairpin-helix domain-containing protein [Fibrobacter sp.]